MRGLKKDFYIIVFFMACILIKNTSLAESGIALTTDNLSNISNYQEGSYQSWGGAYEPSKGKLCSKSSYITDKNIYYIAVNDSRIKLTISEFSVDGQWIRYSNGYQTGSQFEKQAGTAYIKITVYSEVWGTDIKSLFNNGLTIGFSDTAIEEDTIPKEALKEADFNKGENWKPGCYAAQTGLFSIAQDKIAYYSYCIPDSDVYSVNLPGGYLNLNIVELDDNEKVIKSTDLQSGQHWQKQNGTSKIALTVSRSDQKNTSYEEYKNIISNYQNFGLQAYNKYYANSKMKQVSAGDFVNQMNVGWNLGNSLDSKCVNGTRGLDAYINQEMNWGNPYISKDLIDYVAQSGINTIRIPVTWYYNTGIDENGNLVVGSQWLARVQEVVDYAIANNMYVILNSHHDQPILYAGVSEDKMQTVLKNTENLWRQIAEYFKDYDEHLIFEGFNEIDNLEKSWNYGETAADQMNRMNQTFVNTVRNTGGNNTYRILMVPTLLDGITNDILKAFILPSDVAENRIIIQVHSYSQKYCEDIEETFAELERFSKEKGAPVIIGEFGTTTSFVSETLREMHASNFVARAAEHGIKCIWWDNGSNYAIIDRRNLNNSNIAMINALLAGSKGVAYQSVDSGKMNQTGQFEYKMPDLKTGAVGAAYWGTITTSAISWKNSGTGKCMISLASQAEASDVWIQRILFYAADGAYIEGKEIQKKDIFVDIPANTAYIRVSLNSPYRNISWENYMAYLQNGKLILMVSDTDTNKLQAVSVLSK